MDDPTTNEAELLEDSRTPEGFDESEVCAAKDTSDQGKISSASAGSEAQSPV